MKEVNLQIETADGCLEKIAELTIWLKDQIKQLPIESIEIPKASALPEGARVGDPFSWGLLTVKLAPVVVNQLLNLLRDRINRQNTPAKVVVECDGKRVSLEETSDPQQLEAAERFLKEIDTVMPERRAALLIACDDFVDPKYKRLSVSVSDARTLARLLSDPEIGQFSVDLLVNEKRDVISERLEDFFAKSRLDDVLLLYFAGHGDLDDLGNLYFIAKNTKGDRLRSSGIPAQFIRETMVRSSSTSQMLILDCCYSGTFSKNWVSRADASVGIRQKLAGEGRIVLTASEAIEFAYEKREPSGAVKSVFTSRIIEGIDGGQADLDGDGFISIDELYKYVEERIRSEDPSQRPLKSGVVHGQLWLGRAVPRKDAIPRAVFELLNHILGNARIAGIGQLQKLVSANEALYPAAVQVLNKMLSDGDTTVQLVAGDVLERLEAQRRESEERQPLDDSSAVSAAARASSILIGANPKPEGVKPEVKTALEEQKNSENPKTEYTELKRKRTAGSIASMVLALARTKYSSLKPGQTKEIEYERSISAKIVVVDPPPQGKTWRAELVSSGWSRRIIRVYLSEDIHIIEFRLSSAAIRPQTIRIDGVLAAQEGTALTWQEKFDFHITDGNLKYMATIEAKPPILPLKLRMFRLMVAGRLLYSE